MGRRKGGREEGWKGERGDGREQVRGLGWYGWHGGRPARRSGVRQVALRWEGCVLGGQEDVVFL